MHEQDSKAEDGPPVKGEVAPGGLTFERAEVEGSASPADGVVCTACSQRIPDAYYEVNGQVICTACRDSLEAMRSGPGAGRFLRALGAGLGAALAGCLVYYAIRALTGYEFGLIAIGVGLLVGGAVRWGSRRRGGWVYQALAIFLTYTSIVFNYAPDFVASLRKQSQTATVVTAPAASPSTDPASLPVQTGAVPEAPKPPDTKTQLPAPGPVQLVLGLVLLLGILYALPFLGGFENIMGILIIGIGLYEAWKMNRRVDDTVTGPYRVRGPTRAEPHPAGLAPLAPEPAPEPIQPGAPGQPPASPDAGG